MAKNICLILLLTCMFSDGFTILEDHFKKIGVKPIYHKMDGVDFIYMINLDQRPEKFQMSQDQLLPYGINPYRFSAVNGWELSLETILDVGVQYGPGMLEGIVGTTFECDVNGVSFSVDEPIEYYGRTYFCHKTSKGCIGIALSHLSVLQDAYESGYETIWVMEDDIKVLQDPTVLTSLIEQLDLEIGKTWDVLFTDRDIKGANGLYVPSYGYASRPNFFTAKLERFYDRPNVGDHFRKIGSRFGAHSMIIRRSGIEKILEFMKDHHIFLPYDMEYYLPNNIQMYTVLDDVVGNLTNSLSDNGSPYYLEKLDFEGNAP
jgi:GR25 family glycosyltransferase involved in LPS biosynthesis